MKIYRYILPATFMFLVFQYAYSQGVKTLSCDNTRFSVSTDAPPAVIYLEDSQGRITGANPAVSVGNYGEQEYEHLLMNIPNSYTDETNLAVEDENTGEVTAQDHTFWELMVCNDGIQTYVLHILGVKYGVSNISITGRLLPNRNIQRKISVLVEPNKEKMIYVTFNPYMNSLSMKKEVSDEDLLNDVNIACNLNLIRNRECYELRKLAERITDAISNNNDRRAKQLLIEFIGKLKKPRKHDRDEVDVYSILREDVIALLMDIDDGVCHRNKHQKIKFRFHNGWKYPTYLGKYNDDCDWH